MVEKFLASLMKDMADSPAILAKCTIWRARVNPSRQFDTQAEAEAYEAGWNEFLNGRDFLGPFDNSPAGNAASNAASLGWMDAEKRLDHDAEDLREERMERDARRDE